MLLLGSRNRLCTAYYIRVYCGMVVPCCIIHHCCLPLTVYVHSIITQLEKLKKEAAEESRNSKMEETDIVMAEIEGVPRSTLYMPFSAFCLSIYFTLEGLSQILFLYQFSLKFSLIGCFPECM